MWRGSRRASRSERLPLESKGPPCVLPLAIVGYFRGMTHERDADATNLADSDIADGSNYRVSNEPGDESADGSNYRDDDAEDSGPADGSNYRVTDEPGSVIADGSNYRDEP